MLDHLATDLRFLTVAPENRLVRDRRLSVGVGERALESRIMTERGWVSTVVFAVVSRT